MNHYFVSDQSQDEFVIPSLLLQIQAEVIAIGISGAVREELKVIASNPERNLFYVNNFEELAILEREVSAVACSDGWDYVDLSRSVT